MPERQSKLTLVAAVFLAVCCVSAIFDQFEPSPLLDELTSVSMLAYLVLQSRWMAKTTLVLLAVVLGLVGITFLMGQLTIDLLCQIGERAGYFAFFIVSLQWLSAVAARSHAVADIGVWAAQKPPSLRYVSLTIASHAISVLLLAGTASLLGTATRIATETSGRNQDPKVNEVRQRRMTLAVVRASGAVVLWVPTTLNMAVLTATLPGLLWSDVAAQGFAIGCIMMLLGGLFDYMSEPKLARGKKQDHDVQFHTLRSFATVSTPILAIFGFGSALYAFGLLPQLSGLLFAALVVAFLWVVFQAGPERRIRTSTLRIASDFVPVMTNVRSEIGMFAAVAAISVCLMQMLDPEMARIFIEGSDLSPNLVIAANTVLIVALAMIGISPVITISVTAGALWASLHGAVPLQTFALSILSASAICAMLTNFSMIVRFAAAAIDQRASTVGLRWNGRFAILALAANLVIIWIIG